MQNLESATAGARRSWSAEPAEHRASDSRSGHSVVELAHWKRRTSKTNRRHRISYSQGKRLAEPPVELESFESESFESGSFELESYELITPMIGIQSEAFLEPIKA